MLYTCKHILRRLRRSPIQTTETDRATGAERAADLIRTKHRHALGPKVKALNITLLEIEKGFVLGKQVSDYEVYHRLTAFTTYGTPAYKSKVSHDT